jgi:hypothetical protein
VELILKITLAHLIGDFVFQTSKMVDDIETNRFTSKYLYVHIFIHFLLVVLITAFEQKYLLPAGLLAISHFFIDILTKIVIKNSISKLMNLLLDQTFHLIAIALFINYFHNYTISITFVSAILMKRIMEIFNYSLPDNGIKDAGKYIGILERLFIFTFVVTSFWEGVGFLLAAKSIFRFGDLKENKEIKLTEYILIGTLISFGIAVVIAKIYLKLVSVI